MAIGNLTDDLALPDVSSLSGHPMDSSRILRGLMALSRQAEHAESDQGSAEMIQGVISKGVLRTLLSALHFRDISTVQHSRRVAKLATGLAGFLGWESRQLKLLEIAGLLHDIGKIGVPDSILFKPGLLSPDEAELMSLHYNIGIDVLQACRVDTNVVEMIGQSHCHYGSTGDALCKSGSDMSQGARILAIADAYDSLATDQVYRPGKSHEEIIHVMTNAAGTQFDGNIVRALDRFKELEGIPAAGRVGDAGPDLPHGHASPEEAQEASSLCHIFSYLYLLESLYDGFYLIDSDLKFVVWNRGLTSLLQLPASQALGRIWSSPPLQYLDRYGNPLPDEGRHIHNVIETAKSSTEQFQIKRQDGTAASVEVQSVPLLDEEGRLQGVAEIFRDLSRNDRGPEYRELKLAASRDSLTNVSNRGTIETQLAMMIDEFQHQPEPEPFSVIFFDVDHFKQINDTHGHAIGDEVLVDIARLMQQEMYSGELLGRYGGEEFVILCPGTPLKQAMKRAERLRLAICAAEVAGLSDEQVTASFGVAEAEPGDSVESIFRRVDRALYVSKNHGRNQVNSLTSAELREGRQADSAESGGGLKFTTSFQACVAADMVVYKLGGFVDEQHARLIDVAPKRAVVRLGNRGLLPTWGNSDSRRPVTVELEFGTEAEPKNTRQKRAASRRVEVHVRITPLGWIRNQAVFEERCKRIVNSLKEYFLAD